MLAHWSTIGALGRLCWHSGRSTRKAVTVKESIIGALESFVNIVNYYRTTGEAVMEKKCTNGALGRLCWNSIVL